VDMMSKYFLKLQDWVR